MTILPDAFPAPAYVEHAPAAAAMDFVIVRNSLGETMVQTLHPVIAETDAALLARLIDPHGPVKAAGGAHG